MNFFYFLFLQLLLFPVAFGQNNGESCSALFNRDVVHFINGDSVFCEVVEVNDGIVFYEQIPSSGLLSASLSEVKDLKLWKQNGLSLADTSTSKKRDPLYQQGRMDAKKYYLIHLKNNYSNPKNPRNALLSNPSYAAGYKDGAQSKKNRRLALIWICSPLILPMILGFIFYCLIMVS
ncbi:MAG: hypothetical protein RL432_2339 [Bacteroidota bacterium]|jgi:hypothetical protein